MIDQEKHMNFGKTGIDNLEIHRITDHVLLVHQIKVPSLFSCCDGLIILPGEGRNSKTIVLDLNIEPKYIQAICLKYGPVSDYVNTHGHMDHIAHVHAWEKAGATIHAPQTEARYLEDLFQFYKGYGWDSMHDFSLIKRFASLNQYMPCKKIIHFRPGDQLQFDNFAVNTMGLSGHSVSHVGFFLPSEKLLHVSCIGFDMPAPGKDGFGPWYGFKQCSISTYLNDIDYAESIYLENADFLTSSHAYVAKNPDTSPFDYMRSKISRNQIKVDQALRTMAPHIEVEEKVKRLLEMDLFFPKYKIKGFLFDIYTFWESWMIKHHMRRSNY
jgi:glyoxylase-like metal-dependent hydrolase (beta-lactamase superfamily II)